jgi:hypothetical protein
VRLTTAKYVRFIGFHLVWFRCLDRRILGAQLATAGLPLSLPSCERTQTVPLGAVCVLRTRGRDQSAVAFSRIAASNFLMSSDDNCGRSILIVSLLNFAVSGNGGR